MSEDKTYNGWKNYETWCVNLWISNDYGWYTVWNTEAFNTRSQFDAIEDAIKELAYNMEKTIWKLRYGPEGLYDDMFGHDWSTVNWRDIAEGFLESLPDLED
jgi:hypothetical protein